MAGVTGLEPAAFCVTGREPNFRIIPEILPFQALFQYKQKFLCSLYAPLPTIFNFKKILKTFLDSGLQEEIA